MLTPQELTVAVKQMARALGADLVGIASTSRYGGAPPKVRPQAHLPEAKAVIVMAIHHLDASVDFGAEPNSNFPGGFQIGMIPKLDTIAFRVARGVEALGYATVPIACTTFWHHRQAQGVPFDHAASFSHINAFTAAGLGEYGWHGMAMSPQYGPRQRIISVITAAPLIPDPMYTGEPLCDRCKLCETACWGENYRPGHLLEPKTVAFTIEGKKIEYAHINRWRCFWGEQCHLDMKRLAERQELGEQAIYDALDEGIDRVVQANAGYMCSSFKYCMAKPVRVWDKAKAANPRRRKNAPAGDWPALRQRILELAAAAGAARVAIRPLADFASLKDNFYDGFRTEDFFRTFKWVVTIARERPAFLADPKNPLTAKNMPINSILTGGMMIGTGDIGRFLDDSGYEAMQPWGKCGFGPHAARLQNWPGHDRGELLAECLVTDAPLQPFETTLDRPCDGLNTPADIIARAEADNGCFPFIVQQIGAVRLDDLPAADAASLKQVMPTAKSLLVVAAELPKRTLELACNQEAECGVSYLMTNYQALREAFWAAHDMATGLKKQGFAAEPLFEVETWSKPRAVPQVGALPDLRAQAPFAAAAGLGFIGKNGFLIHPQYGPRLRFAFVLTAAKVAPAPAVTGACPDACRRCADACPVNALDATGADNPADAFPRHEVRCQWARVMGMTAGEGSAMAGWRLPDLPVPDTLDDASRQAALARKDPIQVRCYQRPNMADTQVERCLQACPFAH